MPSWDQPDTGSHQGSAGGTLFARVSTRAATERWRNGLSKSIWPPWTESGDLATRNTEDSHHRDGLQTRAGRGDAIIGNMRFPHLQERAGRGAAMREGAFSSPSYRFVFGNKSRRESAPLPRMRIGSILLPRECPSTSKFPRPDCSEKPVQHFAISPMSSCVRACMMAWMA